MTDWRWIPLAGLVTAALAIGAACARPNPNTDAGKLLFDSAVTIPVCGNGILESGEACDPPNATCDATCQVIPPPPPMCGNSILEAGEECDPPDMMMTCAPDCTSIAVGSSTVGGPCEFDSECPVGPAGSTSFCVTEEANAFPRGFCILQDCIPADNSVMPPIVDNCPSGATCRGLTNAAGGVTDYCLPDCVPAAGGNGGCRTDTTTDRAYACIPDLVAPAEGFCFAGCETDVACNGCDEIAGACFGDGLSCATDLDCAQIDQCLTDVNLCVPGHPGNAGAEIGDPCTADADCPQYSFCASNATAYPGGYCAQFYCASFPTIAEYQCGPAGVCPASSDFYGPPGLLNFCAKSCLVDTAAPNSTCDADRGDANDYECMEIGPQAMIASLNDLFDDNGAGGFCFQCEGLFGTAAGCP